MDRLARLEAVMAIQDLKARYFRCVDTKDWAGWRSLFTDDAVLKTDGAVSTGGRDGKTSVTVGGDAIVAMVAHHMKDAWSVHHGHMPEIDVISETEARGIWAMADIVMYPDRTLHGAGHYLEEYRRVDGQWRISTLHLRRLRVHNECT
ncbi:nuclear transport factor 2 family protein [Rhizorhabdus sp.]|jgi:hypothetical protein|uniref:nuclear transport factor 2 family protein n=1 Tax=Rhizorhabdus sp. TaxID=1968843 RepID=UPI0019A297F8|nr:nuclear transport factor 2 family protein [Rhizorhabdus sp.]MBD3759642.1 nuclear transport factor 2 family protein [Rhizorhabdus sp.]